MNNFRTLPLSIAACLFWACSASLEGQIAAEQNCFVVLSGGANPLTNSDTQFLQAQAWTKFLLDHYPKNKVWIFFGAGNRTGQAPLLKDVYRRIDRGGKRVDDWFCGTLPQNNPATRKVFLKALIEQVLPIIQDGGTLYFLVGDHGSLGSQNDESNIVFWHFSMDSKGQMATDADQDLSVSELRQILQKHQGRGHVLFCMTQCFSGGFHFLALPKDLQTDGAFDGKLKNKVGEKPGTELSLPNVVGFTSTTPQSVASGCLPHADPQVWRGFDRRFTEALSGYDLVSGKKIGKPSTSFSQAFKSALSYDLSLDQPYATSDQLLYQWANKIEEELVNEPTAGSTLKQALNDFKIAMDGTVDIPGPRFRFKRETFAVYDKALLSTHPSLDKSVLTGSNLMLEQELAKRLALAQKVESAAKNVEETSECAWKSVLRPAWKRFYLEAGLTPLQIYFEKTLFNLQDNIIHSDNWNSGQLNEVFLSANFAQPDPAKIDLRVQNETTEWAAQRQDWIANWATRSSDPTIRKACTAWTACKGTPDSPDPAFLDYVALHRIFEHRSELAAWAFLYALGKQKVLDNLERLMSQEESPLPEFLD